MRLYENKERKEQINEQMNKWREGKEEKKEESEEERKEGRRKAKGQTDNNIGIEMFSQHKKVNCSEHRKN